jgi:hypothetical protein
VDKTRQKLKLKRQPTRRRRHQSAWIAFGGGTADCECGVEDVSQSGAKLTGIAAEVGSQFAIALVPRAPKRPCEVVWRRGNSLGIRFLG